MRRHRSSETRSSMALLFNPSASTLRGGTAPWRQPQMSVAFAVRLGMRMVKGLANAHAAAIVAARADQPFASVDDLWRRAGVPSASLVQLAEADAFRPALVLARREALWAIKA